MIDDKDIKYFLYIFLKKYDYFRKLIFVQSPTPFITGDTYLSSSNQQFMAQLNWQPKEQGSRESYPTLEREKSGARHSTSPHRR